MECSLYHIHTHNVYRKSRPGINALRHKVLFNLFQQKVLANYAIENLMQPDENYLLIVSVIRFNDFCGFLTNSWAQPSCSFLTEKSQAHILTIYGSELL